MKKLFEGIQNMKKLPDAIFVTDVKYDDIAVKEAQKSKVKIIGLVDTNADPTGIDYPIPCNDDATKAIEIMCNAISEAANDGKQASPATVQPQPAKPAMNTLQAPAAEAVLATDLKSEPASI